MIWFVAALSYAVGFMTGTLREHNKKKITRQMLEILRERKENDDKKL